MVILFMHFIYTLAVVDVIYGCIPADIHAVLTYGTEPAALRYTAISHVYECDIAYIYFVFFKPSKPLYFHTFIMFFFASFCYKKPHHITK